VLAGPAEVRGDLPSLRAAKLTGAFERKLVGSLARLPDAELRYWVTRLIDREPGVRKAALEEARAWLAA